MITLVHTDERSDHGPSTSRNGVEHLIVGHAGARNGQISMRVEDHTWPMGKGGYWKVDIWHLGRGWTNVVILGEHDVDGSDGALDTALAILGRPERVGS